MIDRDHKLPLARQAKAVGISRGSIYYRPRPVGEAGLGLMRRIDELHLEYPFAGSRMMRGLLRQEGLSSGRRHIATLMRRMGIDALYRKPNTSRRRPGHTVYPYLLRGLEVSRPNQVWAMDITYIPMARGFVYLAAVMDWHSRKVLAWRVSVTMDTDFCVEALEESLGRHGAPEIFNTDQGSQFTSDAFTGLLKASGIQISMDGKGSWKDNVFVERLWKSVKYEEVYLRAYESVPEARTGLGRYFEFYNAGRPHSSLGGMTPDQFFDRAPAESGSRPVKWCKSASSCCCCLGGCRLREIGLRKSFVEGQNGGCEVSTSDDPFVVLLSQDGANEAAHGRPVREDAHHIGASPDLLVETLLWVVGPELLPVGEWEAGEGQDVGSRFVQ